MDPRQQDALVQRLVRNPQDQSAIAEAHAAGQLDPEGYGRLLEKVGVSTQEPSLASHWLNEAANVWLTTFQDPARAANALLAAIDRDPLSDGVAKRLADLYRASNDGLGLVAALERRAQALGQLARREPDWLPRAAELYEELGRLCAEPPLSDLQRAKAAYARAVDLDPTSQFAIYSLRELHKAAGEFNEALPYFGMEVALVSDAQRKLALYLDEVEVAKHAGRPERAQAALRHALKLDASDPTLRQQLATLTLEKYRAGVGPSDAERVEACELFVGLAEQYPGEHGFLYALCALELVSVHDRAVQLAIYFGEQLGRVAEVAPLAAAYVRDNPAGVMIGDARRAAGNAAPLPPPAAAQVHAHPAASHTSSSQGSGLHAGPTPGSGLHAGFGGAPAHAQGHVQGHAAPVTHGSGAHALGGAHGYASPEESSSGGHAHRAAAGPVVPAGVNVDDLLERADALAKKSRKNEAIAVYRQILDLDPINADALSYLQEQLPVKRKYAELREVLLGACNSPEASDDDRLGWLRECAAMSESQLRDLDGAIRAWQRIAEIDPSDEESNDQLKRLLERARRWDELALVLEGEAQRTEDTETRLALERNVARLHADKRKDPAAAGESWARIADLAPEDETALQEAVRWFELAGRADRAADVITAHVAQLDDDLAKRDLYLKLGNLRSALGQHLAAAEALAEGADELGDAEMWARAEGYFVMAQAWEPAAHAADEQSEIAADDSVRAAHIARAAGHLVQGGDSGEAISRLEQAVDLAPTHEPYSSALEELLVAADRVDEMVSLFLTRATKLSDPAVRVHLRKRAAVIQRDRMGDEGAARGSFALVLQDQEDAETLEWLAREAEQRGDVDNAVGYLHRLVKALSEPRRKVEFTLHEAYLCEHKLENLDRAASLYESILKDIDRNNEATLQRLGNLELGRDNFARGAEVLEQYLEATTTRETKLETASRLAEIYELRLSQPTDAIRLLNFIHSTDPDDLDATQRLCQLAEAAEQWPLVAELMVELIAIEGEEEQVSAMTRRLAEILHTQLGNGAEALNVLGGVADQGDEACRQAYIDLGDELGEKAVVARRIVAWHTGTEPTPARADALHAAFSRFVESNQGAEAIKVAKDLAATDNASADIAETLEGLAVTAVDREALSLAHELRAEGLVGNDIGAERVRQAEVLAGMGVDADEAVVHGELGLAEVELDQTEALLARLAKLCVTATTKIDVYERQIARCESLEDRLRALCRTTEVAAELADLARAGGLFEMALGGSLDDAAIQLLVDEVRAADKRAGSKQLTETLATALAGAGQGARDGGRTRARMLRIAANLAYADLADLDRALGWLGDALLANVEDQSLEALETLAGAAGDYSRADEVLTRALGEVFDGPLVRRLLARRAKLRKERMGDPKAAADDLKRLHELSPSDIEVSEQLSAIYEELGDYRGMVALLEDQILRNRDKDQRSELARRVAVIWEERLADAREAADAWRRVLRLIPGDEQAKQGLARAKEGMLDARAKEPSEASSPVAALTVPRVAGSAPKHELPSAPKASLGSAPKHELPSAPVNPPASVRSTEQQGADSVAQGEGLPPVDSDLGEEPTRALGASLEELAAGLAGAPAAPEPEEEAREALVDALRRSDLPPDDETLPDEHRDLEQLAPPAAPGLDADDDFDTATEVTSRAVLSDAADSLDLSLPDEDDVVVEDDLFEVDSEHPGAPEPPRRPASAAPPPKPAGRSAPPPRRRTARH